VAIHFFLNSSNIVNEIKLYETLVMVSFIQQNLTESPIPDVPLTPERVTADPLRVSDPQGMDRHHPEGDGISSKFAFKRRPYVKYHMVSLSHAHLIG